MKCKICNRKEQCNFCGDKVDFNTTATLTINCDLEDFILGVNKKLKINNIDNISYSMCMKCYKQVMEANYEPK